MYSYTLTLVKDSILVHSSSKHDLGSRISKDSCAEVYAPRRCGIVFEFHVIRQNNVGEHTLEQHGSEESARAV